MYLKGGVLMSLVVSLLVAILVVVLVFYLIDLLALPANLVQIVKIVVSVLALIWLVSKFFPGMGV